MMKFKFKIKITIGTAVAILFSLHVFSQDIGKVAVEVAPGKSSAAGSNQEVMVNSDGKEAGTYKTEHYYDINFSNGSKIQVPALTQILYSEESDRIITYGDNICMDMMHKVDLNIYTKNGALVKHLSSVILDPFKIKISNNGDIYLFGYKENKSKKDNSCFLIKYNKMGEMVWENEMDAGIPMDLVVADNNQFVAVANYFNSDCKVKIFKSSGSLIDSKDFTDKPYLEFFNKNVAIVNSNQVALYKLESKLELIGSAKYAGKVVEYFPILYNPTKNLIILLSGSANSLMLQAYNAGNCTLKYRKQLNGYSISNKPFRALVNNEDKIRLKTLSSELDISLTND
jgi:hypothetical protein